MTVALGIAGIAITYVAFVALVLGLCRAAALGDEMARASLARERNKDRAA